MTQRNYQTVKLDRGRHASPDTGVCAMELSSMLAGEAFSDRPRSVSPMISAFVRCYNDLLDDRRRQDLYRIAAEVVGTAGSRDVEMARAARLQKWGESLRARRWWRRRLPAGLSQRRLGRVKPQQAGIYAAHSIFRVTDEIHRSALALIEELVAMGPITPWPSLAGGGAVYRSGSPGRVPIG